MGKVRALLLLLVLVMCYAATVCSYGGERREREGERRSLREDWFLLQDSRPVVKTEAGEMRVVRGVRSGGSGGGVGGGRPLEKPLHVGFINMEPSSLFIPQYLDSSLILFVRQGVAKLGHIHKEELVERELKAGDIYRIKAGSAFYLENTAKGQKLNIICSIATSENVEWHTFHSFFVGGGMNPSSILSGFDPHTLSTAFNVSVADIRHVLSRQKSGPIVYVHDSHPRSIWTQFLKQEHQERKAHLNRIGDFEMETNSEEEGEEESTWSLRKLLISVLGEENKRREDKREKERDSYNIYERRSDFKNKYGWIKAVDESDYYPLVQSGIGINLVHLTLGSMLAPHVNPTATEYGIVLRGTGQIQIVYPNGTLAMNAKVCEGDVFRVPRYFPFSQIASRTGPFEFLSFTTCSRKNRPQFLAGANSILHSLNVPEVAESFGISQERLRKLTEAQREAIILPPSTSTVLPDDKEMKIPKAITDFGTYLW